MFIKDLLGEFNRHLKDGLKLDAGQVVWWAVHKDEFPGHNKTIENTRMVPVILSIASQEDLKLKLRLGGYSDEEGIERMIFKEIDSIKDVGAICHYLAAIILSKSK